MTNVRYRMLLGALFAGLFCIAGVEAGGDASSLAPGDIIRVAMTEDPRVTYAGPVSAAGTIQVPFLGQFKVAGLSAEETAQRLEARLTESLYQRATVDATLIKHAPGKVYIYGAVREPGSIPMPEVGEMTVLDALSEAGGMSNWSVPEDAYVVRNRGKENRERIPLNLAELINAPIPEDNKAVVMQPGDVLFVPGVSGNTKQVLSSEPREIIIVGEIRSPGIIKFAPGERCTLMRAIFKAGGLTKFAKGNSIRLIRYGKNDERTVQDVDVNVIIEKGHLDKDVELLPGDMLIVPGKLINFY